MVQQGRGHLATIDVSLMSFRMIVVMVQIECGVTIREEEEDTQ